MPLAHIEFHRIYEIPDDFSKALKGIGVKTLRNVTSRISTLNAPVVASRSTAPT